jgi:phosphate transport system permease protein
LSDQTTQKEAYADSESPFDVEESMSIFQRAKLSLRRFVIEVRHAKGAARIDLAGRIGLVVPAFASILTIVLILTLLMVESVPILTDPNYGPSIFTETVWGPSLAEPVFGILVFIAGSFYCSGIAIGLAVPLGIGGAILLSEFAPHAIRSALRMIIEMMAAIPSIVYGLWAFTVMRYWVAALSTETSNGLSLLSGGLILAVMLLPTVVTVSEDALQAVPNSLREASLALGASRSETARKVVLSAALPGVGAAVVLSLGRAIGETMAILLVTGNSAQIPFSLFDPCYVMTSVIANQLGTAYTEELWRSALFSVALVLMLMSVAFTLIAKLAIRHGMKTRGMT